MPLPAATLYNLNILHEVANVIHTEAQELKFQLLDRIIDVFRSARKSNTMMLFTTKTYNLLTKELGMSDKVANQYIDAAKARI